MSLSSRSSARLGGVVNAHVYSCAYVCVCIIHCICVFVYIYVLFFEMSVACTSEQVFWAPVHVQVYTLYRCFFDINVHMCDTLAAGVHIYVYAYLCVYACISTQMRMCVYDVS